MKGHYIRHREKGRRTGIRRDIMRLLEIQAGDLELGRNLMNIGNNSLPFMPICVGLPQSSEMPDARKGRLRSGIRRG